MIGANSVFIKDIPDYCVAVGSLAKVIKKYNFRSCKWEKYTDEEKLFFLINCITVVAVIVFTC